MRLPKWTTRRIIGLVFLIALILRLSLSAWEVSQDHEFHWHAWIDQLDTLHPVPTYQSRRSPPVQEVSKLTYLVEGDGIEMPFWPRYWRSVCGLPWKKQKGCHAVGTQVELICELDHPEFTYRIKLWSDWRFTTFARKTLEKIRSRLEAEARQESEGP